MAIKKYKPITSGRRNMASSDFAEITTSTPEKSLLQPLKNNVGHNNSGYITVRHQGGGHERQYRVIDFKRSKDNVAVIVKTIEYDPSCSINIALVYYEDGVKAYILALEGLEVDMHLVSGPEVDIKVSNISPLENISVGTVIHNTETGPDKGGQSIRSTGTSTQVLDKEGKHMLVRLNFGEVRMILATCRATVGSVGNEQHGLINIGEADRPRWMRKRPTIRGSVMDPSDYPHGGGEGKTSIGRKAPVSPWGQPAIGYRTRNKKAKSDELIARRRTK